MVPTGSGWGVRGESNSKLAVKTNTKAEVRKIGTQIAKIQHSELTILKKDVKFKTKIVLETIHFHREIKSTGIIDISREKISISCPECYSSINVTIVQILKKEFVICGCGNSI